MLDADVLSQAIANAWESIAELLGDERESFEYALMPLLRELESKDSDLASVVRATFRLFQDFPEANEALLRAIREIQPSASKGGTRPQRQSDKRRYMAVSLVFGTDRDVVREANRTCTFGSGRGDITYGVAEVSIPDDHRTGRNRKTALVAARVPRERRSPRCHCVFGDLARFGVCLVARASLGATRKEILLFVHGYNVGFDKPSSTPRKSPMICSSRGSRLFIAGRLRAYCRAMSSMKRM